MYSSIVEWNKYCIVHTSLSLDREMEQLVAGNVHLVGDKPVVAPC